MRRLVLLVVLILATPLAAAYPAPSDAPQRVPAPCLQEHDRRIVYDYVGVLRDEHAAAIEGAGCEVYRKTGAHFVFVAVPSTDGEILENYALHLFEAWGIGQNDVNDGVMLLYVQDYNMSGAASALRVEVGYGLEGVLNARVSMDAIRLMQDAKRRALEGGMSDADARSQALAAGSAFLLDTLDREYVDGAYPQPVRSPFTGGAVGEPPLFFWGFVILLAFLAVSALSRSAQRPRRGWGYRNNPGAWQTGMGAVFLHEMLRHRRPPGGGGFGGGGFGGGGFGGGGFGGGRSGGGGGSGGF